MLGWEIIISRKGHEKAVASWLAGLGGTDWIEELVSKGLAKSIKQGGYPDLYDVSAAVLLSTLAHGVPSHSGPLVIGDDYVHEPGYTAEERIDIETLRTLDPNEVLTVTVWDQS